MLFLEGFRKGKGRSKERVSSLWLAVLGAFAVPLGCWKVCAHEFTFIFWGRGSQCCGPVETALVWFSSWLAVLGAFAAPLGCWVVRARNDCCGFGHGVFHVQFLGVTGQLRQRLRDFFLPRCASGDCRLLETELVRVCVPICSRGVGKRKEEGARANIRSTCCYITLGFVFLIFLAWLALLLVNWDSACVIFFVARCSMGFCRTTRLLEGEPARIYIRICCCGVGIGVFKFHVFPENIAKVFLPEKCFYTYTWNLS